MFLKDLYFCMKNVVRLLLLTYSDFLLCALIVYAQSDSSLAQDYRTLDIYVKKF